MPKRSAAELHYDASWESAPQGRPLSLSLPFQPGNLALRCGVGANAEDLMQGLIERTESVIDTVSLELPQGFPDRVAGPVLDNFRRSAVRLRGMPSV